MGYSGKPSRGCQTCRERKIKCVPLEDGANCKQCLKLDKQCTGYLTEIDALFKHETVKVTRKAQTRKKERSSSTSSDESVTSHDAASALIMKSQAPGGSLSVSLEDRSVAYFMTYYVVGIQGNFRSTPDNMHIDDTLLSCMCAVGYAGMLSQARGTSRELENIAKVKYGLSLQLLQKSLRSSAMTNDSTLLSIMLMSMYETMVSTGQKALSTWAYHHNGALAVIKARGKDQLVSFQGRTLLRQIISALVASNLQRDLHFPAFFLDLVNTMDKLMDPDDVLWHVHKLMIQVSNFNADVNGNLLSYEEILSRATSLDEDFITTSKDLLLEFAFQTIISADPQIIRGVYHVYRDYLSAQTWNGVRTMRILLNNIILQCLNTFYANSPSLSMITANHTEHYTRAISNLRILSDDILASVPQHFGFIMDDTSTTTSEFLWSHFRGRLYFSPDTYPSTVPFVRATHGFLLPWSLYTVGGVATTDEVTKKHVVELLHKVQRHFGVMQAAVLAERLQHEDPWRTLSIVPESTQTCTEVIDISMPPVLEKDVSKVAEEPLARFGQ